ncbi:MAG: ferredoxin--NADP reductase [Planctomycetota bacterium]
MFANSRRPGPFERASANALGDTALPTKDSSAPQDVTDLRKKHYNATVIERLDCHENLARFRIRPDAGVSPFEPGQYVTLGLGYWEPRLEGTQEEVVEEKKQTKLARRAYSISCPLTDPSGAVCPVGTLDYLEFYITLVRSADSPDKDPPVLTPRLFCLSTGERLAIGKKITGKYTLGNIDPDHTVLMLGTGTGEAPHNAMTAQLLADGHRGRIINACCGRYLGDLAYQAEHERLMRQYDNYFYLPCTTREPINLDPQHDGYVGKQYLQDLYTSGQLAEQAGDPLSPSNTHVFLCGNPSMIGYVPPGAEPPSTPGMITLLEANGFSSDGDHEGPGRIQFEKYW